MMSLMPPTASWLGQNPRARGLAQYDKTCFNRSQRQWGTNRDHYPPIVFRYERQDLENDPRTVRNMMWGNKFVIDWWFLTVKDYAFIPRVLSSEYEGAFMEASMRLHDQVIIHDFKARM